MVKLSKQVTVEVPVCPSLGLLHSMAMRYRHDFGLLSDKQKDIIIVMMRQIHEEVVGKGFYKYPE